MSRRDAEDVRFMRRAIELAGNAPALPFGALIVHGPTGRVVAEGWNRSAENPTWHGEIVAINALVAARTGLDPAALVLYTTAEPCPMCQGAILWAGLGRVVFGTSIASLRAFGWRQIDITAEELTARADRMDCEVVGGVLESDCDELFLSVARAAPGR